MLGRVWADRDGLRGLVGQGSEAPQQGPHDCRPKKAVGYQEGPLQNVRARRGEEPREVERRLAEYRRKGTSDTAHQPRLVPVDTGEIQPHQKQDHEQAEVEQEAKGKGLHLANISWTTGRPQQIPQHSEHVQRDPLRRRAVVRPAGLEPATSGLGNRRSIRMSYGRSGGRVAQVGTEGALLGACRAKAAATSWRVNPA